MEKSVCIVGIHIMNTHLSLFYFYNRKGIGRASYMNTMPVHLCKFDQVFAQVGYVLFKSCGLPTVQVNLIGHVASTAETLWMI
jgi:hypothetical protein